eukprot:169847_1
MCENNNQECDNDTFVLCNTHQVIQLLQYFILPRLNDSISQQIKEKICNYFLTNNIDGMIIKQYTQDTESIFCASISESLNNKSLTDLLSKLYQMILKLNCINNPFGILITKGYICNTLQGYIHEAVIPNANGNGFERLIIKQTSKILIKRKQTYKGQTIPEDFNEEMRILNYVSNQKYVNSSAGICLLKHTWEDTQFYYYSMQYCQCELLKYIINNYDNVVLPELIKRRKTHDLTPFTTWITFIQNIFRTICRSVAYLHSIGIAHLDLSLENIMVYVGTNNEISLKLIDFGVAHDYNKHKTWISNKRVGKPRYMAYEVWNRKKGDCRAADVWSLAVILFIILTGIKPFQNDRPKIYRLLSQKISQLVTNEGKTCLMNEQVLDLLQKVFVTQHERITMVELLRHPFVGLDIEACIYKQLNVNECKCINFIRDILQKYNDEQNNEIETHENKTDKSLISAGSVIDV